MQKIRYFFNKYLYRLGITTGILLIVVGLITRLKIFRVFPLNNKIRFIIYPLGFFIYSVILLLSFMTSNRQERIQNPWKLPTAIIFLLYGFTLFNPFFYKCNFVLIAILISYIFYLKAKKRIRF